jgi:predicted DNA-binding transcriptional regulator AlpA
MENIQSDILTVDEAAELLKIPRSSVYKLAQQRKIPAPIEAEIVPFS